MQFGGVVLCGGRSSRMGTPKLALPFGDELLVERTLRLLGQVVRPLVIVAAPGQELPELPREVIVVRDQREGRGPLEGLLAGLSALPESIDAAYATSCDAPLLVPAFVRRMTELLGDHQIAVPQSDGFHHPLAAVYRRSVLNTIESLLAADRLRPVFLFDAIPTRVVQAEELMDVDPELSSLVNLNHPAEYLAALARAGLQASPEVLARLGRAPGSNDS